VVSLINVAVKFLRVAAVNGSKIPSEIVILQNSRWEVCAINPRRE